MASCASSVIFLSSNAASPISATVSTFRKFGTLRRRAIDKAGVDSVFEGRHRSVILEARVGRRHIELQQTLPALLDRKKVVLYLCPTL